MSQIVSEKPATVTAKAVTEASIVLVLMDKAQIKLDQDHIKKNLTKLDMQIHSNAVQCMLHAEKHGDTSLMRRLLVDIIDEKTGYRRRGLINWMRKWSPMELNGDTINLSGVDNDGNKRPFQVDKANAAPFWLDSDNAERVARPVYQAALVSKVNLAIKEFRNSIANTMNGKPIDADKPFYDGLYTDELSAFFDDIETRTNDMLAKFKDNTQEVRKAQDQLRKAEANVEALKKSA